MTQSGHDYCIPARVGGRIFPRDVKHNAEFDVIFIKLSYLH